MCSAQLIVLRATGPGSGGYAANVPGIHTILCVRDEADILPQTLPHMLEWSDSLHVYDTGSTDGTWEIVQDAARRDARVNLVGHESIIFDNDTRGFVFERVKHQFRHGDWVCRADADEFYHVCPREFLTGAVRACEGRVCTQQYEFMMTRGEAASWMRGEESVADRARPIAARRRWFMVEPIAELRFCRYRRSMRWGRGHNFPFSPGRIAFERIPVRHYRWRDPEQMEARCRLRAMMANISHHGDHWSKEDWHSWLVDESDTRVSRWEEGRPLPVRHGTEHLVAGVRGILQNTMYRCGLPRITDVFRRGWRPEERPQLLDSAGWSGSQK